MTERYDHSPEQSIDLTHLLELSKHFLKGTPEVHGSNYEPIRLPLLWLIKEEDVVFGYRNIKRDYLQEFSYQWNKGHTPEMSMACAIEKLNVQKWAVGQEKSICKRIVPLNSDIVGSERSVMKYYLISRLIDTIVKVVQNIFMKEPSIRL